MQDWRQEYTMSNKPIRSIVPFEAKNSNSQFVKCPLELLFYQPLSAPALRLYLILLSYCYQDKRECWPSVSTLQELMQTKRRSIQRWLAELENFGFVEIGVRAGYSNIYLLPELDQIGKLRLVASPESQVHASPESQVHASPESQVHASPESHESDPIESDLREKGRADKNFPEFSSPIGDIAQSTCGQGYVALLEAGISAVAAKKLVAVALSNGRGNEYVEGWLSYCKSDTKIKSLVGYLNRVIGNNDEVPIKDKPDKLQASKGAGKCKQCGLATPWGVYFCPACKGE
jgi:hypothetical protein